MKRFLAFAAITLVIGALLGMAWLLIHLGSNPDRTVSPENLDLKRGRFDPSD